MLEKVTQLAEAAATNASRRTFLGKLGRAAAGAAGILGGLLLIPSDAQAGRKCHGQVCPPELPYCCKEYDPLCRCNVWYCSATRC